MTKVTLELTVDQLIDLVKELDVQDQLKLVTSLLQQYLGEQAEPETETRGTLRDRRVRAEVERLVRQLRDEEKRQADVEGWLLDEDDADHIILNLDAEDFQA